MTEGGRVVTANLPAELVSRLDEISKRLDRSKSWIVRQAVAEWLAEEQRRDDLTSEALERCDREETLTQEDVEQHFAAKRSDRLDARAIKKSASGHR